MYRYCYSIGVVNHYGGVVIETNMYSMLSNFHPESPRLKTGNQYVLYSTVLVGFARSKLNILLLLGDSVLF